MTSRPTARIACADAAASIQDARESSHWPAVFTSLPDAAETGQTFAAWRSWFTESAFNVVCATDPDGYAVFYQTDRRHDGRLESKSSIIIGAARDAGAEVVWHKVAVATMGKSLFRPAYTHLIAVSVNARAGRPTPDVFEQGKKIYKNATDAAALDVGLDLIATSGAEWLADPFCGRGSIAHAAAMRGMSSWSIDIDEDQVRAAAEILRPVADVTGVGW